MNTVRSSLVHDLQGAGLLVEDVWDLVNTRVRYKAAIPILVDWLQNADVRIPEPDEEKIREGIIRALTVPDARPEAVPVLLKEFRQANDPSGLGLRWVVGNALGFLADDSIFDDIAMLVKDVRYGKARQMLVEGLAKSRDPRAVPLLADLLSDEDVAAHAVRALAKLRPSGVRHLVEPLLDHPQPLVRKEANKALTRLSD